MAQQATEDKIKIDLTLEQRDQLNQATGYDVASVDLDVSRMHIVRRFFDAETCARLRSEAHSAESRPAILWKQGVGNVVDESLENARQVRLSEETRSWVEGRLLGIKATLERHFGVVGATYQSPQVLLYRQGGFVAPHRDNITGPDIPEQLTTRLVAVVIFLSGEAEEPAPNAYGGGRLTFYGLFSDPQLEWCGVPVQGEEGMLIAFHPEVVHAVSPVTFGERYTMITWLEA
jgi:predicted 2-oxoglutarate/Fe(II)-dependent dioxygenase YbiX